MYIVALSIKFNLPSRNVGGEFRKKVDYDLTRELRNYICIAVIFYVTPY